MSHADDPEMNAALEADAAYLEAMGADPGLTLEDIDAMTDTPAAAEPQAGAELKACPFCDGVAELDAQQGYRAINGHFGTRAVVYCMSCGADIGLCKEDFSGSERDGLVEAVVEAWNRRPTPDTTAPASAPAVGGEEFLRAVRMLVVAARTSGGTAGRDDGLCAALDAVEAFGPLRTDRGFTINRSKEWWLKRADAEGDHAITAGIPDAPPPRADAAAESTLEEACKPWQFSTGDPPDWDSPLHQVFVAGMLYSEDLLAKALGVSNYEGGDGSEDFDQDASKTLMNILVGAGLYDDETGAWAKLPTDAAADDVAALRTIALEISHYHGLWGDACAEPLKNWSARIEAALASTQRKEG